MRRLMIGALLLAWLPAVWASADDKDKPKPDTPAEEWKALLAEYNKAYGDLLKPLQEAKTEEEAQKVLEQQKTLEKMRQLSADYGKRALAFAEKHAKDRDAALDALLWLVQNNEGSPEAAKAVDWILRDYLNDKKIDSALSMLAYNLSDQGEKLLRAAAAKIDEPARKAQARYALAQNLKNRADVVPQLKGLDEKTRQQVEQQRGKEYLDKLAAADPAKLLKEAEDLFEALAKENGDVKVSGQMIKELVEPVLFEIRNLAIGKPAPEIEGEDIDGKTFKLSEYKGKVVVLDFWGHW
jgi:DNA mismatch repair ATPase MutS